MAGKNITLEYEDCLLDKEQLQQEYFRLQSEVAHLEAITHEPDFGYKTDYAFVSLPFDSQMRDRILTLAKEKKELSPNALFIIGIGGSNLGCWAIDQALRGVYGEEQNNMPFYYADTIDTDQVLELSMLFQERLKRGERILLVVVSKSGVTTETAANLDIFLSLLQIYHPHDYFRFVVAITDFGSALWTLSQELGFSVLEIPQKVGGRFSFFSAGGLFPLAVAGINIEELCAGAREALFGGIKPQIFENDAALRALILYIHNKQGVHIHDSFLFSTRLAKVGLWYRQLMGESIGKEYDLSGRTVFAGITPTVSIGTTDLHSVAQLYLGGPFDKITTFVACQKREPGFLLVKNGIASRLINTSQDISCGALFDAIFQGTKEAYKKSKRPFMTLILPEKSAFFLGQLLQMYMLEMVYLGYLLRINPFDQPNVELYKKEARQLV